MNEAIIDRIETTTSDTTAPTVYYTCQSCGYRNVMSRDNYCPNCGKIIYYFYTKKDSLIKGREL